ncbi:hypothetical protein DEJ51_34030 [Streptomyces venezuelae]|uniref:Uncharacterized protein n=1 Tax=Streptomyces venezuelae TaxID=54571 RepID=A0A5P2E0V6_STRVZ|nr:hypothetical protein [Streptomyces venezuelae]QES58529.1 hypothetical protein DEJ51_34030 [Streptomyces venezuelae]
MTATVGLSQTDRSTVRFHLTCLAALLPYHQRPAALQAWLGVDPALFHMGFDPPTPVTEAVLNLGGARLQAALAGAVRGHDTQRSLLALDVPVVDTALRNNHQLDYETSRLLRLRNPAATALGRGYQRRHHHRALLSGDPDLAAAALVEGRGEHPATTRATAWATVRAHGGTARVREVVAALPGHEDPVDADVVAACAQADPQPYLDTAGERHLGTGALLTALRAAHRSDLAPWRVRRAMERVLAEPYRIDWALVAAARLGRRLPRTAVEALLLRPDCPPEVAVVLRTGQPPRPGRPLPPPARGPAPRTAYRPPPSAWVPEWRPPGDTGPFGDGAESARRALRTLRVAFDTREDPAAATLDHLSAVIERGQLPASEAVRLMRPADVLTSWVGQGSGWHSVQHAAWSGRAALHVHTAALLARWSAGGVPAERWAAFHPRLWRYPGTLPELLSEVSAAVPDPPDAADGPGGLTA